MFNYLYVNKFIIAYVSTKIVKKIILNYAKILNIKLTSNKNFRSFE